MAEWARDALASHFRRLVTVSNDPDVARTLGIPGRRDRIPGLGPIGGLLTALEWAGEEGMTGLFLLACDLPLVGAEVVGRIVRKWRPGALAAVPGSYGPLGFEPLCGAYSLECLPLVRKSVSAGDRSLAGLLADAEAQTIPTAEMGCREDVIMAFSNVNTPQDRRRVEEVLLRRGSVGDPGEGRSDA
jgi:molybdopterin-guanine dinucleotide biosynthesis protein A